MKAAETIGFSKEWARKHTKAEFIEQHKHQKDLVKDLGKEWEKLQEKQKPEKAAPSEQEQK